MIKKKIFNQIITFGGFLLALEERRDRKVTMAAQEKECSKILQDYNSEVHTNLIKEMKVETFFSKLNETAMKKDSLQNKLNNLRDDLKAQNINLEEKSKILEAIKKNQEERSNLAETMLSEARNFKEDYTKNDIFGFIDNFLETYKNYLSTLSVEQLTCVINISGLIWIILILNGIVFTYYGNKIINRLNLEKKFPKLAKIIKLRTKISEKTMQLEVLYLYGVILLVLITNIAMLLF